jgi:hypothetical protein
METTPQSPLPHANDNANSFVVPTPKPSNLLLGAIGGLAAAAVGAGVWAAITVATEYQIGYMAVGVGFIVGLAVRFLGRGSTLAFGVVGAALSLLGCVAGNLLSGVGFIAASQDVPFAEVLRTVGPDEAFKILKLMASPIDLLFYGLALWCGFKYSMVAEAAAGSPPAGAPAS